ncbi:MAG TPA: SIS domain-containing protein, partial [Candidatus Paceibacterota bacterium]|nr:SIS domain-containing protein [Candidatus Paceibacterota bacterium]
MNTWLNQYVKEQQAILDALPLAEIQKLIETFRNALLADRQIFVCGNGGSAANASHFITDLGKGASDKISRRFRCLTLNDNVAWLTALGNDYSYEDVFVGQLMNFARPGDLLFAMSVSGNSPNLVKAFQWAKEKGITTLA